MASVIYPKAKEQMWKTGVNALAGDVKAVLVDIAEYTYNAAHEFLSDVPAPARVATSPNLANKTVTDGILDADDVDLGDISGAVSEAVILYVDTGTAGTSRLLLYIDSGNGLPITPEGPTTIEWNDGDEKIAAL